MAYSPFGRFGSTLAEGTGVIEVGSRIRAQRRALGLTLAQLGERSGVSRAMISEIELGRKNPTIRVVYDLARALNTTIADLLDSPASPAVEVIGEGDRQVLVDPESGVERHLLSPALVSRGVHVLLYRIPAGADLGDFPPEPVGVLKHVTLLNGLIEGRVGGEAVTLRAGDSITFPADTEHGGRNPGDAPAEVLIVVQDARHRVR